MALVSVMFGTAEFAVPILDRVGDRSRLSLVVTTPPQPGNRGRRMPTPVAQAAAARGLAVRTPSRTDMAALADEIRALGADVLVVAAYGRILPRAVVDAAPVAINVHPSLLPRHRGAAPVARTLLEGDAVTGVTLLGVGPEVDAAPMYDQVTVPVKGDEDRGALEGRLSQLAANRLAGLLLALEGSADRLLPSRPQEGPSTYAQKLTREDEGLRWQEPAEMLVRRVRALGPRPGARARMGEEPLLVLWAEAGERPAALRDADVGTVGRGDDGFPWAAAGEGTALRLARVRPAGKATMDGDAFLRGRPQLVGARLGDGP